MLPLFSKQLEAVELDNINQLISEGYPEGSTVEYKESLFNTLRHSAPNFLVSIYEIYIKRLLFCNNIDVNIMVRFGSKG